MCRIDCICNLQRLFSGIKREGCVDKNAYAISHAYAINDAYAELMTWRQNGFACALKIAYAITGAYVETQKRLENG